MSIVSSYTTPDAELALKRQRRVATATSMVISILVVILVGVLLALILLPVLRFNSVPIVA